MRALGIISNEWDNICPECESTDLEIQDSTEVDWCSDDEGFCFDLWQCKGCNAKFRTKTKIEVTKRWMVEDL